MKEQEKNKMSVLVAESAYISQKAQFGLVMIGIFHSTNIASQINCFENKKSRWVKLIRKTCSGNADIYYTSQRNF